MVPLAQGGTAATYHKSPRDVRFGSEADMCVAKVDVRFTPNSDRKSRHPQTVMSALPPKADMCGALADVCYGPKADIAALTRSPHPRRRSIQTGCLRRLPWQS